MKKTHDIKYLFEPKNFAVIGASQNPKKIGHTIVKNLLNGEYTGKIFPVSPKGGEILGQKVYPRISDIKEPIDVASLVIPAQYCVDAVRECAKKGVKFLHVITSGFSEVGNQKEEDEMLAIAHESGMRILGPNIFGMFSSRASMNATFSATSISHGNVAILTQSGALGIAMIGKTAVDNLGLSAIVSTGNKSDIDESDLLEYLIDHEETKVILMYIEGIKNGERLLSVLKRATMIKPVVVIKSGRSKRGAMAAASHTGSLAGSDNIFEAVIKQYGVIRAESIDEAFNWCKFLALSPMPENDRTVIVTNGGGVGVMATDACEKYNIELYDNQEVLHNIFEGATPSYGSTKNPIDITGGAMADDYTLALTAPADSNALDSTIALYCETSTFDSDNLVPMIRETYEKHKSAGKPITYAIVGGEDVDKAISKLNKENVPVYSDVYSAVSCLGVLNQYKNYKKSVSREIEEIDIDIDAIESVIDRVIEDGRNFLLAHEAGEVMEAAGIRMPKSKVVKNIIGAINFAENFGYPLVMKVVSRDIVHKSDAGGIALDLQSKEEVLDAYSAIIHNCKKYNPNAVIDGIELAEMVDPGLELVIGAVRDSAFGPIVMCGLGGIYVEVMKDVSFRSFPLNREEVFSMLRDIRSFPLLMGVRGEEVKDIDGVIQTIIKVGTILNSCKRISDIEINPVRVYSMEKGLISLDARILLTNTLEEK